MGKDFIFLKYFGFLNLFIISRGNFLVLFMFVVIIRVNFFFDFFFYDIFYFLFVGFCWVEVYKKV